MNRSKGAQNFILLYRGFIIRQPFLFATACQIQFGEAADFKPALRRSTK